MPDQERRTYRRLDIRLPLECYRLDDDAENTYRTVTLNVSTGGICFETDADDLEPGALLHVELTVPPGDGHWPWQGRVSAVGEVVRVMRVRPGASEADVASRFAIAARFRESLKLSF